MGYGLKIENMIPSSFYKYGILIAIFSLTVPQSAPADILTLHNGDKLNAKIEKETATSLWIQHESLGKLEIPKEQVESVASKEKPAPAAEKKKGDTEWKRRVAAGYELAKGNTEFQRLNGDFLINRNRMWVDEWTWSGRGTLEKSDRDLTVQTGAMNLRYGYSIRKRTYNFYRVSAEHDLFEDLRARIIPSTGLGYWFSDTDDLKLLTEGGVGYKMEYFRPEGSAKNTILHTRAMVSKKISEHVETGLDGYYFPAFKDFNDYRLEAEAFVRFMINENFAVKVKAENQYKNRPRRGVKKNDLRLISTLEYSF